MKRELLAEAATFVNVSKSDPGEKATALKQLIELHESGALSDDEFSVMREELLNDNGSSGRTRNLILVSLLVVVLGAAAIFVLAQSGSDSEASPESAVGTSVPAPTSSAASTTTPSTTDAPARTNPSGASTIGSSIVRPLNQIPSGPQYFEERRAFLFRAVSVGGVGHFESLAAGWVERYEERDGLAWAPNGLSSAVVAECAEERFAEFSDYERLIDLAIEEAQRQDPLLENADRNTIRELIPPSLWTLLYNPVDLSLPFVSECAGFPPR
jgi:hypothetical protein